MKIPIMFTQHTQHSALTADSPNMGTVNKWENKMTSVTYVLPPTALQFYLLIFKNQIYAVLRHDILSNQLNP